MQDKINVFLKRFAALTEDSKSDAKSAAFNKSTQHFG
jgi:hypothetical protein